MASKTIKVEEIEDGMVLAKDASTKDGNILLATGTKLQEKHASLLEKRGIKDVHVSIVEEAAGSESEPAEQPSGDVHIDPSLAANDDDSKSEHAVAVEKHLDQVFSDVKNDDLMKELLARAKAHAGSIQLPQEPL